MLAARRIAILTGLAVMFGACAAPRPELASATRSGTAAATAHFTEDQSNRGERTFNSACASCHAPAEFSGRVFLINWESRSVGEFYSFIRSAMPYSSPGSLTDQQYVDVTAYILRLNEFPAGGTELPPDEDAMRAISFSTR